MNRRNQRGGDKSPVIFVRRRRRATSITMSTQDFYAGLPALTQFLDLANPGCYVDAPNDWYVVITDVAGSTQAIASGQYKEVNSLGASSIIAALNVMEPVEVPFVFGGDGATLLIPPAYLQPVREALLGIRTLARQSLGMELRVGVVPVATVQAEHALKVAKLRLSPHYCQASFMGGGITYATELIKTNPLYRLDIDSAIAPDLTGLECRWQDIPSPHGQTLSLIVAALPSGQQASSQVYREVIETLQGIYGDARNYHPVQKSALKLSLNPQKLRAEIKLRSPSPQMWHQLQYGLRILLENLLGILLMRLQLRAGDVPWGQYKDDVCAASDYQKIDDVLRMVIAGNSDQTRRLIEYLEGRVQAGQLAYGLHVSNRALMTCLIFDRRDRHFHLIDGADGGYAAASIALKLQLHRKVQNWKTYTKLAAMMQQQQQKAAP